jgi:protocatechuate 3,4-dioxygenase beta subunit
MQRSSLWLLAILAVSAALIAYLVSSPTPSAVNGTLERDPGSVTARGDAQSKAGLGAVELGMERSALEPSQEAVRVAGAGELAGIVRARESGLGVGDVLVSLYSYPPQGAEFVRRVMKLSNDRNLGDRFKPLAKTRTSADGRFRVQGVLPGKYFVEAVGTYSVPDPIERVVVSPAGAEVELYVRSGARVTGQVLLPGGDPAVGAIVHVGHGESQFIPAVRSGDITERSTKTDGNGRFDVGGLPPSAGMQVTAVDPNVGITFAQGLDLEPGATLDVTLSFAPQASLTGRTLSVANADDPAATPLAGVQLAAVPRGLREMQFVDSLMEASHGTSNTEGVFHLSPLAPGTVDVLAWAPGHRPARVGPIPSDAGLELSIGDVKLERGPLARGRVIDAAGNPLEDVSVRWEPFLIQGQLDLSFAAFLTQAIPGFEFPVTNSDGVFEAGPFPNRNRQRLYFSKPGFQMASATWRDSGEALEVVLHRGGSVSGQVIDRVTREPIQRFVIQGMDRIDQDLEAPSAFNPFGTGQVVEHPDGRFVVPAIKRGGAALTFEAKGYLPRRIADLRVEEGAELTGLVVELDRGATVRGIAQDAAGVPVAGARIVTYRDTGGNLFADMRRQFESGERNFAAQSPPNFAAPEVLNNLPQGVLAFGVGLGVVESSVTGPDGRFEIQAVDRGEWRLLGYHREFAEGTSDGFRLDWPAGEAAPIRDDVVVEMTRGASLVGTVRDRRGNPQRGVIVLAFSPAAFTNAPNSGGAYQGESKADGSYAIANMVGGGYFLMVTRGDEHLDPFSFLSTMQLELVVVPNEGEVTRDLVDQSAATTRVFGTVRREGVPAIGGSLLALSSQNTSLLGVDLKAAAVGHDGSYQFPGLPPGTYHMRYVNQGRPVTLTIDVPDRPEVRIDLSLPVGSVSGRVIDATTGRGVARAFVDVKPLDQTLELGGLLGSALQQGLRPLGERSNAEGEFKVGNLEPGRYLVEVNVAQLGNATGAYKPMAGVEIQVYEGVPTPAVLLELEPSLEVRGRVTDPNGMPLSNVRVSGRVPSAAGVAAVIDPRELSSATTNAEGTFVLRGVGAGALRLRLTHRDYAPLDGVEVDVTEGQDPLEFIMYPGTPVTVRVLDATGAVAYGATARLLIEGGADTVGDQSLMEWFNGRGIVGLSGVAKLGSFAPGTYRLEVSRGDEFVARDGVRIESGVALELEARLE